MHKGDDGMCTNSLACRTILHKGANEGVSVAKPLRAGIIRMSRGPDGGTQLHCQTTARLEGAGRSPDLLLCPPPALATNNPDRNSHLLNALRSRRARKPQEGSL